MDDSEEVVSTGTLIQLHCCNCGALNIYKRKLIDVSFLNDTRKRLVSLEVALSELLAALENLDQQLELGPEWELAKRALE